MNAAPDKRVKCDAESHQKETAGWGRQKEGEGETGKGCRLLSSQPLGTCPLNPCQGSLTEVHVTRGSTSIIVYDLHARIRLAFWVATWQLMSRTWKAFPAGFVMVVVVGVCGGGPKGLPSIDLNCNLFPSLCNSESRTARSSDSELNGQMAFQCNRM